MRLLVSIGKGWWGVTLSKLGGEGDLAIYRGLGGYLGLWWEKRSYKTGKVVNNVGRDKDLTRGS